MKLITFDFWNTLFLDQHEGIRHKKRIAYCHGLLKEYQDSLKLTDVETAFQVAHELFLKQWDNRRAFTMDHHARAMLEMLGCTIAPDHFSCIVDYFETVLLDYPPVLISNAPAALRFACTNRKVGLISDTGYSPGRTLRKILARHDLENCFHAFSFSNETGVLKPHPLTFQTILDALKISPEEAVHIGDLEETDIAGAKVLGMKAIKFIGANPESTRESIADAVIEDLTELPAVLERI